MNIPKSVIHALNNWPELNHSMQGYKPDTLSIIFNILSVNKVIKLTPPVTGCGFN